MLTAEQLISLLELQPHPEGGFYRETYRCREALPQDALPERYAAERRFGTAIYFLLTADSFSAMHKLASDEIFHFYLGDAVEMLLLDPQGGSRTVKLGRRLDQGEHLQVVVPHRWWQGSRLIDGGSFALVGCTVAPGFEFADFEIGAGHMLQALYPEAAAAISRLTRI